VTPTSRAGSRAPNRPTKAQIVEQVRERPDDLEGGLALLREGVEVAGGIEIDFLAADATGRAALVLVAEKTDDALFLRVLDVLGWAREAPPFFERIGEGRIDVAAEPRLFLLLSDSNDRARRRLEALASMDVTRIRVEWWKEGGVKRIAFLRETTPEGLDPERTLGDALRPLWREAVERLQRLDPSLEIVTRPKHVEARFGDRIVAVIGARSDRVRVIVPGETEGDARDRVGLHRLLDVAFRPLFAAVAEREKAAAPPPPAKILSDEEVGELTA